MVESEKSNYMPGTIFQGKDGRKYGVNPFASSDNSSILQITHSEPYTNYCGHCNLSFEDLVEYEHHNVELHRKKKLICCNICNATFKRQDHLKRHKHSLHTNEKYCNCPVCGKDCQRQDLLAKHIKNKHSSKPEIFHCRACTHTCNSLSELESHEYNHLVSERHSCPHCSTTFKRRDHMLRHIKSQHLNHMVMCPICNQVYKRRDHVARHVREKHQMGFLNGKLVKSSDIIVTGD